MAKGYAGYISQGWKILEQELLLDACMKQNCNVESEDLDLFEDVIFKDDDDQIETITEEPKYEIALYPIERYLYL